jgi:anti-anti-sigma factor
MVGRTAVSPEELSVRSHADSGRSVVTVRGEIDMMTAPALSRCLEARIAEAAQAIVVDLAHVTFLGASGLAVLADAQTRANGRGLEFRVVAGDGPARRYLSLVGLEPL